MTVSRIGVVHLGRPQAWGERRRVASWCEIVSAAGGDPVKIPLLAGGRRNLPSAGAALAVGRGLAVPETAAWSLRHARAVIDEAALDGVVFITLRAYRHELAAGAGPAVLDYVDRLSVSYADRSAVTGRAVGAGLRLLGRFHGRLERDPRAHVVRVAAGHADAAVLGAEWVPNVVAPVTPVDNSNADHDVVFVGNLAYPPNIEAVAELAAAWPEVRRRRPQTTALIAGASPAPQVTRLVAEHGWTLLADFPDERQVYERARVAVAPLTHASGIQNKLLDAAALGLPILASDAALAGFAPPFPAASCTDAASFVDALLPLLDDGAARKALGEAARAELTARYAPEAWAPWARAHLAGT